MRPTKPITGPPPPVALPRRVGGRRVELDRAVDDVGVEAVEAVGDRLRVGEDDVGLGPVARHAVDDVVDVQHRAHAAQRRQQPPADRRVEVDDVEALGQAQRARPRGDRPRALAVAQAADVQAQPG